MRYRHFRDQAGPKQAIVENLEGFCNRQPSQQTLGYCKRMEVRDGGRRVLRLSLCVRCFQAISS